MIGDRKMSREKKWPVQGVDRQAVRRLIRDKAELAAMTPGEIRHYSSGGRQVARYDRRAYDGSQAGTEGE